MAVTQIRGSTQILDASITVAKLAAGFLLPTANLTNGADFIQRGGSVAFTAAQSMGGFILSNVADAVAAQDAVNLRTAQALINGVALRRARNVAITNLALTGLQNIDGTTAVAGDRTLLTAQSSGSQNGPWVQAAGAWARPADWAAASAQKSTIFFVEEGTVYKDTKWIMITDAVTVDTTATTVSQDLSGTSYTNGTGLSLTGSTFAVKYGQGVEDDGSGFVRVKLDGASLARSASGVRIASGTAGQVMMADASGLPLFTTFSGDATVGSTGVVAVNNTSGSGYTKYTNNVFGEVPAGLVNSANTAYTLANTPWAGSVRLYLNGMLMKAGAGNDYTISTNAITMLFAPTTGDVLIANYMK